MSDISDRVEISLLLHKLPHRYHPVIGYIDEIDAGGQRRDINLGLRFRYAVR